MTVSVEFGELAESAKYLTVETGFSPDIPKKPKLWMRVSNLEHLSSAKPEKVECNVSEEEILRRALQNEEIRGLAEGKDLVLLITPSSSSCDRFYYVDVRELREPISTLRFYFYYPESGLFIPKERNSIEPWVNKTCEVVSEEEVKDCSVSLNAENKIYIKCLTYVDGSIAGTGFVVIGWNDSMNVDGFEVSRAEIIQLLKSFRGCEPLRDHGWLVRNPIK